MKLYKIDSMSTGFGDFVYVADFPRQIESGRFAEIRSWCTGLWGPTVEIDIWYDYNGLKNPIWSWQRGIYNNGYKCKIYISSEEDAALLRLAWC